MEGNVTPLFPNAQKTWQEWPHNIEAEASILGTILTKNHTIDRTDGLKPDHFYDRVHGRLFAEISRRCLANQLCDAVTLKHWLERDPECPPGQASAILSGMLTAMVSHDIRAYVDQVRECWRRREGIAAALAFIEKSRDHAVTDLTDQSIKFADSIDNLNAEQSEAAEISFNAAADIAITGMVEVRKRGRPGGLCIPLFPRINRHLRLRQEQLTILGGQSGEGKSAIGWQIFNSVAEDIREQLRNGIPLSEVGGLVGLSFEMSATSLANRAFAAETGIAVDHLENGILNDHELALVMQARERLRDLPILFICVGGLSPTQIRMRMRQAQRKLGGRIALTLIDHVQLVEPDDQFARSGGAWATGKVADAILRLCKDFKTHVIALSQVDGKEIAKRPDKRPTVDDLRWSANFRNNADYVAFIHRPEAHLPHKPEQELGEPLDAFHDRETAWNDHRAAVAGKAELYGPKARNGSPDWSVDLFFNGPTTAFAEDPSKP